ncbi:hypothetical protein MTR67_024015 [Solanum verrucosum]|uniref:Uncharacterized protein n=1 Tax=Solanum verrucosum TaxID=315347 RepID=A0AAF0R0W6_SOLVR|nr:hypothetical protein MTR67_024015 [Solanum verrucosum]
MKLFMGGDIDLFLDGLKLVGRVDRSRVSSSSYGEGESDLRKVENGTELSKILH